MFQPQMIARSFAAENSTRAHTVANAGTVARVSPAVVGLALTEAAIGYEWLLSGLNKVLSPTFSSGLAHELQTNLQGNPNQWYVSLANTLMIPHARVFATLAEAGELLVGLGMFAGAILWVSGRFPVTRWARLLNLGVIAALMGGILLSANYAVMSGETLPGINAGNPFNEGLSIDSLLTLIGLALLVVHMLASRARGRTATY